MEKFHAALELMAVRGVIAIFQGAGDTISAGTLCLLGDVEKCALFSSMSFLLITKGMSTNFFFGQFQCKSQQNHYITYR